MASPTDALLDGEFTDTDPSALTFSAAACPQPLESTVNKAGLKGYTGVLAGALEPEELVTTTSTKRNGVKAKKVRFSARGTWMLICPGETKKIGAETPSTVTEVPASSYGNGSPEAEAVPPAKLSPKIAAIEPGAIGCA